MNAEGPPSRDYEVKHLPYSKIRNLVTPKIKI